MHVITGLGTGGAESMLTALARATREAGGGPVVVSLLPGGMNRDRLLAAGVSVHDLGMTRGHVGLSGLFRLVRLIRSERPAILQSWMYHADLVSLLALWLSGRRRRTRLFWGVRCSNMDWSRYRLGSRIVVRLCSLLSRFPDAVIANSEAGRGWHRRLGYRPRRFEVVENGCDPARFAADGSARAEVRADLGLKPGTVVIGTVARADPMKDYPSLLAALSKLQGVVCVAIGKDTENLPDAPGLIRLGERRDVPRLLNALDVFVSSSSFGEGFSNAIVEAMATGLPVVATDVGDARHIVGDAGLIVPPGRPMLLADAIRRLVGDEALRVDLGAKARCRVAERFTVERTCAAFESIYAERGTSPQVA